MPVDGSGTVKQSEDTVAEATLRAQVRAWLQENWNPEIDPAEWRKIAVDSGWAFCTWPTEYYGRGVAPELAHIVEAEFDRVRAGSPAFGPAHDPWADFMGHAMLAHGSEAMKRTILPKLLRGELGQGVLLYSEPGAGSDLGGLQTRADRDGDGYVINGQKIWSSGAFTADWGMLVARTNWDVPKHRGISYFLFPIRINGEVQKGIDIRPIKQMTGDTHFNEVFFTGAWCPAENLIGEENDGWRVLQTALTQERISMGRMFREAEILDTSPVTTGAADLIELAREANKNGDPVIRQMIAQMHTWRLVQNWTNQRAADEIKAGGSSSLASLSKLANSRILHGSGTLLRYLSGPAALLYDYDDRADRSSPNAVAMGAFVNSVGGGSDQIQRNIIGERILGLPRSPEPDRDLPFRDVRKGVAVRKFSG
jgi:alkylation response protein AidB-like acyl-CoA dehydrogenase